MKTKMKYLTAKASDIASQWKKRNKNDRWNFIRDKIWKNIFNYDYSFPIFKDNLFKIFGTKSYFKMLSPSLRYGPFTGLEWSFQMKDLGFNEYGEFVDNNDEEVNK